MGSTNTFKYYRQKRELKRNLRHKADNIAGCDSSLLVHGLGILSALIIGLAIVSIFLLNIPITRVLTGEMPYLGFHIWFVIGAIPYVLLCGVAGGILSFFRRLSARKNWNIPSHGFSFTGPFRLNTLVAGVTGFVGVWGGMLLGYDWGVILTIATNKIPYGGLFLGLLFDGFWDAIHTRLLIRFGKPDRNTLLGTEARQLLLQQPTLSGFVLTDIEINGDTAIVSGRWGDKSAENDVRSTLLRIAEIKRVVLRRD